MAVALDIGCMSGTSLDGVDAVLVQWPLNAGPIEPPKPLLLAHHYEPFAPSLREQLRALNAAGEQEMHHAALAANALARTYAKTIQALLARAGKRAQDIRAVGAHGQTVRHRPQEFDGTGYTVQLMNGALLAELCGIDVVCDFRSRDLAAGGQGAPLVPAFHAAIFGSEGLLPTAVLNIGGIANLTLLPTSAAASHAESVIRGFDCGPGNVLMDAWCERHTGQRFDAQGAWSAQGQVRQALLDVALSEPYFGRRPPKSTGRDLFNLALLEAWLQRCPGSQAWAACDVQATLTELTAVTAAQALLNEAPMTRRLLVCGGGAFNAHLMQRIRAALPDVEVLSTAAAGVPPDQVEAMAFAWLARAFMERQAGNLPAVTGARGPRVLGALYPAD